MEDRAWDRIMDAIDARYGIKTHGRNTRPVADDHALEEKVAFITFEKNGQTLKVERVQGPAIIDRKTIGARRAGSSVHYQNVYDPNETSLRTIVYRQDPVGEWEEVSLEALELGA